VLKRNRILTVAGSSLGSRNAPVEAANVADRVVRFTVKLFAVPWSSVMTVSVPVDQINGQHAGRRNAESTASHSATAYWVSGLTAPGVPLLEETLNVWVTAVRFAPSPAKLSAATPV
jgi:hypothetical protein